MVYNSRLLALLMAVCISVTAILLLFLFGSLAPEAVVSAFLILLSASFLVVFVMLEWFVFREIERCLALIEKLRSGRTSPDTRQASGTPMPLKIMCAEIASFASLKEKEIDELRKLEAFRKEFIADVSHELKTPIFAAQGFVHTLLDGAFNDKTVRNKFLKKAAKSLDGLDILVQDLLTLSQIETGQIRMRFELFDAYALTQDVFEQFESKSEKKEVILKIESDSTRVMVYADRQRIAQVMTNLISNAIKHSFEGEEVMVILKTSKKSVRISVKDFGEGIPEEHLPRIFERFYRVDKSRSREKGGTGLGLAIVKHILDGHNTRAEVESTPGKGSVFSFRLPRKKNETTDESE